jgi:SNF2 family DNA or RNA helicase
LTYQAHVIRNPVTKQSELVRSLKAKFRWCVTGTPIQNRVEDFGALLQFIKAFPFDTYQSFAADVADYVNIGDSKGISRLRNIVCSVCLRRTKEILDLPPKELRTEDVVLQDNERRIYELCKVGTLRIIDEALLTEGKLTSFATVLQLILRLRQICNHGELMLSAEAVQQVKDSASNGGVTALSPMCEICSATLSQAYSVLACWHLICSSCLSYSKLETHRAQIRCPICLSQVSVKPHRGSTTLRGPAVSVLTGYEPSSKVNALLRNLRKDREESHSLRKPFKRYAKNSYTYSSTDTLEALYSLAGRECLT